MTSAVQDSHLLDEHDEPRIWSGCVWCGRPMREGGHGFCRQRLSGSLWLPCWACNASRHDATGADCGACFGVGFIESELCWGLVGGGYTPTGEGSA